MQGSDSSRGTRIEVVVTPSSHRESMEYEGGKLRIKVKAPPDKGKANKAVIKLICENLGECELISGASSKKKTFLIKKPPEELETLLGHHQKQK